MGSQEDLRSVALAGLLMVNAFLSAALVERNLLIVTESHLKDILFAIGTNAEGGRASSGVLRRPTGAADASANLGSIQIELNAPRHLLRPVRRGPRFDSRLSGSGRVRASALGHLPGQIFQED